MACRRSPVRSRLAPPTFESPGPIRQFDSFTTSPSSRGLGHYPFTVATGVRIPVGTPSKKNKPANSRFFFGWRPHVELRAPVRRVRPANPGARSAVRRTEQTPKRLRAHPRGDTNLPCFIQSPKNKPAHSRFFFGWRPHVELRAPVRRVRPANPGARSAVRRTEQTQMRLRAHPRGDSTS